LEKEITREDSRAEMSISLLSMVVSPRDVRPGDISFKFFQVIFISIDLEGKYWTDLKN
jgi:maltodextrin utilization protein YvdJ